MSVKYIRSAIIYLGSGADGGYGSARSLDISAQVVNYKMLSVNNFFRVIKQYRTKASGDVNYGATSYTYDALTGTLTFKGNAYSYVSDADIFYISNCLPMP